MLILLHFLVNLAHWIFDNEMYLKPVFEINDLNDGELIRFALYEEFEGKEDLFFEIKKDLITINFENPEMVSV